MTFQFKILDRKDLCWPPIFLTGHKRRTNHHTTTLYFHNASVLTKTDKVRDTQDVTEVARRLP